MDLLAFVAGCAFVPREVNVGSLEGRLVYPREVFSARESVTIGPFEDRRPNRERLGVARNKLMMVTTSVAIKGDLGAAFERIVRQRFSAEGIGDGPSSLRLTGAVLDATTDADPAWRDQVLGLIRLALDVKREER